MSSLRASCNSTCGTCKPGFTIFTFRGQTLNNYILSWPPYPNLTPSALVLSTGNSHCAHRTRENRALIRIDFVFSLAISFQYNMGGQEASLFILQDFYFFFNSLMILKLLNCTRFKKTCSVCFFFFSSLKCGLHLVMSTQYLGYRRVGYNQVLIKG